MTQKGSVTIPAAAPAARSVVFCIVLGIVRCIGRGESGRADAPFGGVLIAWLCFS